MQNIALLKKDIRDVLDSKILAATLTEVYEENVKFFEEILEKRVISGSYYIKIAEISEEDVTILQEYLEYLIMIEQ